MIFQKNDQNLENKPDLAEYTEQADSSSDDIETVVGPSVNVEGDLRSSGNIIVKGTVTGSVNTTKQLTVEKGAKIIASIKAGNALVSGEVKGNVKIKEALELTATSRVLGDISAKSLSVEPGAVIYGKVIMPGVDPAERKVARAVRRGKKAVASVTGSSS